LNFLFEKYRWQMHDVQIHLVVEPFPKPPVFANIKQIIRTHISKKTLRATVEHGGRMGNFSAALAQSSAELVPTSTGFELSAKAGSDTTHFSFSRLF